MHQDDLKENDKFILFCKIALGKTQARHSFPQTEATTFAFSSVFIFLLCLQPTSFYFCTFSIMSFSY